MTFEAARKPKPIKDITTSVTIEDLKRIESEADHPCPYLGRTTLPLSAIQVADKVFQWRNAEHNVFADREHTRDLIQVVADGKPLDPILVMAVGNRVFLVDGHHRLTAYHSQGWAQPVPVRWCLKSIDDAQDEALAENTKNKLPMTRYDRMEAAWRLVKRGDHRQPGGLSKTVIHDRTGVSKPQISIMRRTWNADPEGLQDSSWRDALRGQMEMSGPFDRDDSVKKMADAIDKHLNRAARQRVDIFCDALESLDPSLPMAMVSHWVLYAVEAVDEYRAYAPDLDI